jgi:hypothetical protein
LILVATIKGAHLDITDEGEGTSEEVGDGEAPGMVLHHSTVGLEKRLRRTSSQETPGRRARGEHRGDVGAGGKCGLQRLELVIPKPAVRKQREGGLDWGAR